MKKGNVILTIVSVIVLIVSGIGAYFSYAEYQKAEDLYNDAKQCYIDADTLCRPSFGVVNKSDGETQVCVPKDFSTKIVPKVEVIEKNVKANGDILYILSDENATVFCNEAKEIIISEFKEKCINSGMMSGIKKAGISTNLEEITSDVPLTSDGVPKTPVEILTERIKKIQSELPAHSEPAQSEEEQAFLEAAEEQYAAMGAMGRRRGFINRK